MPAVPAETNETHALALLSLMQLLRQVVLVGHLFDRVQLAFEPIDVMFFIAAGSFPSTRANRCRRPPRQP